MAVLKSSPNTMLTVVYRLIDHKSTLQHYYIQTEPMDIKQMLLTKTGDIKNLVSDAEALSQLLVPG